MAKAVIGTKETALREMRQGTAAKMDAEALKRIAEARAKKKPKPKGKPKPYGR